MAGVQQIPPSPTYALLPTRQGLLSHLLLHGLHHPDAAHRPTLLPRPFTLHLLCAPLNTTTHPATLVAAAAATATWSCLELPPWSPWLQRCIGTHSNQNA